MSTSKTPRQRLDEKYEPDANGCWIWTAARTRDGYGKFTVQYRTIPAHRASYELIVGPIPDGLELDHLCRNRACVNPDHLEPVTRAENARRGSSHYGVQTHCKRGHPFDEENTRWYRGGRRCRQCEGDANRAAYLRRREDSFS